MTPPKLKEGLEIYFSCYSDLQSERQVGLNGLSPIPWSKVIDWCAFHGINDYDDICKVQRYIKSMEKSHYGYLEQKENKKNKKGL